MKVSPELVGKVVAIQLARPVYMFEYAAHVKLPADLAWHGDLTEEQLMVKPLLKPPEQHRASTPPPPQVSVTDVLMGVIVKEVGETYVEVEILDISEDNQVCNVLIKTIPSALIVSIDRMGEFEVKAPTVTTRQRATAGKIVLGG